MNGLDNFILLDLENKFKQKLKVKYSDIADIKYIDVGDSVCYILKNNCTKTVSPIEFSVEIDTCFINNNENNIESIINQVIQHIDNFAFNNVDKINNRNLKIIVENNFRMINDCKFIIYMNFDIID